MVRILLDVGDTGLLVLVLLKDDETVAGCVRNVLMNGRKVHDKRLRRAY